MSRFTRLPVVLCLSSLGCIERLEPEEVDDGRSRYAEDGPEAELILRAANESTLDELDFDAGLSSRAAAGLVDGRSGADQLDGTDDDTPFASLTEVDAVPLVGPRTLDKLLAWAEVRWPPTSTSTSTEPVDYVAGTWSEPWVPVTEGEVVQTLAGMDDDGDAVVVWSEVLEEGSLPAIWVATQVPTTGFGEPIFVDNGVTPALAVAGSEYGVLALRTGPSYDEVHIRYFELGPEAVWPAGGNSFDLSGLYPGYTFSGLHASMTSSGVSEVDVLRTSTSGSTQEKLVNFGGSFAVDPQSEGPYVLDGSAQLTSAWTYGQAPNTYVYCLGMGLASGHLYSCASAYNSWLDPVYAAADNGRGVMALTATPWTTQIIANRWSTEGSVAFEEIHDTPNSVTALAVAVAPAGDSFVAWTEFDGAGTSVHVMRAPVDGPWSGPTALTEPTWNWRPKIDVDTSGRAFVTWLSTDNTLWWSMYDPAQGWTIPAVLAVADGVINAMDPNSWNLAAGGEGQAIVTWTSGGQAHASVFSKAW